MSEWRCNQSSRLSLRNSLKPEIQYQEVDAHINDAVFAEVAFSTLMALMTRDR